MSDRYLKTEAGRAEIRARTHALTRSARNLLLIIDPSRAGTEWAALVQGAGARDLQTLLDAGLVAPAPPLGTPAAAALAAPSSAGAWTAGAASAGAIDAGASGAGIASAAAAGDAGATDTGAAARPPATPAVEPGAHAAPGSLSYSQLYDLLPGLAKRHLGLIKGYRFVLAIERAEGLAGLRKLAAELVDEVESAQGPAASQSLRRALLLA